MHPAHHAAATPHRAAIIMADSGEHISWRELDERSNQGARLFRSLGLRTGDIVAICMENSPAFLEIVWAAQRSGLYYVCISTKLTVEETRFILDDSGARLLIVSVAMENLITELDEFARSVRVLVAGCDSSDRASFEGQRGRREPTPIDDEAAGADMLYSSGSTGRPKAVRPDLTGTSPAEDAGLAPLAAQFFGMDSETVYLSPAPLYHAAPLRWAMAAQRLGGTVVIMPHFDATDALAAIGRYRITHAQFVPTHFVRMLKLPEATRKGADLSSLRLAFHGAAPCPVPAKEAMMQWWGSIIHEFYGGTEANAFVYIAPEDWLEHKGAVGQAIGSTIRICDDNGEVVPPGVIGQVYFEGGAPLRYHNAPDKVVEGTNRHGWTTLGDMGWLDEDGFLYLADRKDFMIISGGVNIYPQEIENLLVTHPKVADAAVVGAPHEDMGEQVAAVVQPVAWSDVGDDLRQELIAFCRTRLSHVKAPRILDFQAELPRHATGKLYKRQIRDAYWQRLSDR